MQYDLLTEPWIPVIDEQGQPQKLGLIALFRQASQLREISHYNPLVVASVYRLCLAVLFRNTDAGAKQAFRDKFYQGQFPASLFDYLEGEHCKDAFDLFSEERPFFQTAGFSKDKTTSVKKLSPEFATANNKTLFSHLHDNDDFALAPDEAALCLLVCQYFSLNGGQSGSSNLYGKHKFFSNAPLVGGAVFYIKGANLYQTLVLNLFVSNQELLKNNKPVWELPTPTSLKTQEMMGISHYLSWQSRHVRLLPDEEGRVSQIYLAQGYENPNDMLFEPYFTYRVKKDGKGHVPLRLNFERDFWRDTLSVLGFASAEDQDVGGLTEEFATGIRYVSDSYDELHEAGIAQLDCITLCLDNEQANPMSWFNQSLPIYLAYLKDEEGHAQTLRKAIQHAETIASNLNRACRVFASNIMMESARTEDVTRLVDAMKSSQYFWPALQQPFQYLYRELASYTVYDVDEIEALIKSWRASVRKAARDSLELSANSISLSSSRTFKAWAFAKKSLEQHLTGDSIVTPEFDEITTALVNKLNHFAKYKETNRGALANLKRCVSDDPAQILKAYRYLEGILHKDTNEWNEQTYCWCAGLFALHQHSKENNRSLGYSLNLLKLRGNMGESFDNRFELLLDAQPEQLPVVLRSMFQMLAQYNIDVDYRHLIYDIKRWHSPKKITQLKWARDFWAPPPKADSEKTEVKPAA